MTASFDEVAGSPVSDCNCAYCRMDVEHHPTPETEALWNFATAVVPALYLDFHGWRSCIYGIPPYEGGAIARAEFFTEAGGKAIKHECDRCFLRYTPVLSRLGRTGDGQPHSCKTTLAHLYQVPGYNYEPNGGQYPVTLTQRGLQVAGGMVHGYLRATIE